MSSLAGEDHIYLAGAACGSCTAAPASAGPGPAPPSGDAAKRIEALAHRLRRRLRFRCTSNHRNVTGCVVRLPPSFAVYVYSRSSFQPLTILARHEKHLSALALSPFDADLLACSLTNNVSSRDTLAHATPAVRNGCLIWLTGPQPYRGSARMQWAHSQLPAGTPLPKGAPLHAHTHAHTRP
jgi:hypothetical protein